MATCPPNEIAVRFHHRLVWIRPFPNGNGRDARMPADLLAIAGVRTIMIKKNGEDGMSETSNVSVGTEYEKFVQAVYQAVLAADGVENVDVQHNILMPGRSGCAHQIDVYWEFKLAGQTYRTAIECKAYNQAVSVGRVRDFYGVLVDVPGLMGVFVTLVGYQSGAEKYARHYGIGLKELRKPNSDDWEGRVKDVHINIHVVMVDITEFKPLVSSVYLQTLKDGEKQTGQGGFRSDEPILFSSAGERSYSRDEVRELLPHENETAKGLHFRLNLPGYHLRAGSIDLPIDGVDLQYDVSITTTPIVISGDDIVKAIIKDVETGELTVVRNDGGVTKPRD